MKNLRFKANAFHLYNHYLLIAGLEFGLATQLLEQEAALRNIQTLLGKSSSSKTTERYTQVSTQEIGRIVNPLEAYYSSMSGTIHSKNGSIKPLKERDNENKHHKGVHIQ